jgi:hypothetical protein
VAKQHNTNDLLAIVGGGTFLPPHIIAFLLKMGAMAGHQRGYIHEAFGAFHVRYYVTEIVEGKPVKKQRSHQGAPQG